jgi:hypothetical protein
MLNPSRSAVKTPKEPLKDPNKPLPASQKKYISQTARANANKTLIPEREKCAICAVFCLAAIMGSPDGPSAVSAVLLPEHTPLSDVLVGAAAPTHTFSRDLEEMGTGGLRVR